jgi:hypothetical protein
MASRALDWIGAASCCEGPRPTVTFADMPHEHRRDIVVVAFAAALSSTYFLTLGILLQPIPSRSLAAHVVAPPAAVSPDVVISDAAPAAPQAVPVVAPPRRTHHAVRPLASVQLASLNETVEPVRAVSAAPQEERHRNVVSRFFRGVFRGGAPAPHKAEQP